MTSIPFDPHDAVKTLRSAGVDERAAEAMVRVMARTTEPRTDHLATKTDLAQLEARVEARLGDRHWRGFHLWTGAAAATRAAGLTLAAPLPPRHFSFMFIRTEDTPNPLTLKLVPGRAVMEAGAREFGSAAEAQSSPLAESLFDIDGVARVFFAPDYLTVTKAFGVDWKTIRAPILAAVMDFFASGQPLIRTGSAGAAAGHAEGEYDADAAAIVDEIKDLLDTRIRPAVAQDGGDITFSRFEPETGVVWLHMRGACAGCPSSAMTLKAGVENMLRHYVPEVTAVEQTL